jgi:hypothetical protein
MTDRKRLARKEIMIEQTAEFAIYELTYEEAFNIIWRRRLRHCEPLGRPLVELSFSDEKDLVLFALAFQGKVVLDGSSALLTVEHQAAVTEFIREYQITERINRTDLIGVWFWSDEDEAAFNEEVALVS